jgi:hypothetical protein
MRGVERAVKGAVLCAALLTASEAALAAAGAITTTVTPLSDGNVTYSRPASGGTPALTTYVGYKVTLSNASGNTINSVTFEGTTSVTDLQEIAGFSSADGATCSRVTPPPSGTPLNGVTIRCALGQFPAGRSVTFALFFVAPVQDATSPLPEGTPDLVSFSGQAITAEGFRGGNSPNDSRDSWTAPDVLLGTPNPTKIKTAVPKSGGSFFTGTGGISLSTDKFATTVTVPPATTYTEAEINEAPTTFTGSCANFNTCFASQLTIPGTFSPYLTIVIRQDATNIKKGTKIDSAILKYFDASEIEHPILDCVAGMPNIDGTPCLLSKKYYKNSKVPGYTSDLDGDFEWTFLSLKNGRFEVW